MCVSVRSGGVHVEQTGSGHIRAHTGSGGVTVHTPAKGGFDLRAHTGSGSITVDRPMTVQSTITKHELMGKVGGGGSAIVDVRTGSGSIRRLFRPEEDHETDSPRYE